MPNLFAPAERTPTAPPVESQAHHLGLIQLLEQAAAAGAWVFSVAERRFDCSERLLALLESTCSNGAPAPDLLVFYAPEYRAVIVAAWSACEGQGQAFDVEVQLVSSQGRRFWARSMGEAVSDAAGTITHLRGVLQDLSEKKRADDAARSVTMRLGTTLGSLSEAFATLGSDGSFTYANEESQRLLARSSGELLGQTIASQLGDTLSQRLNQEMQAVTTSGKPSEFEAFYPQLGKWLSLRLYPFEAGMAVYFRDVTVQRQTQEHLLLLQTSISRLNDSVLITDAPLDPAAEPRIVFVNDAFERLTGYSRAEVLGRSPRLLQGKRTHRGELDRIRQALGQRAAVRAEVINYKKNGELFWVELQIVPIDHFGEGVTHWVSVGRDITERKATEDEIEHLAFYDALTRLPNRQLLMDRLARALAPSGAAAAMGALMFIDLDNFKVLNDSKGHAVGDQLLQLVAGRLGGCVRLSDTVARLGGDEFVVMLDNLPADRASALAKAHAAGENVRAALSEPYDLLGFQHHSTCSVGITLFGDRQQSIGEVLKQADLAMYQAKAHGRNTVCFFDPDMQAAATATAALNAELRDGLRLGQFVLHYQPQVGRDGQMFGVEALLRWQHPTRGLVFPDAFIAQAEDSGLIVPLGGWVLETACAQLAAWSRRPETSHISMAVNVSVRQFRQSEFVDQVETAVTAAGVRAYRLKLELTESLLATGIEVTIAKMGRLKAAGVTLSIDDFGMGYSALSYLKHLPIDQLKIDRYFVKDILTDPNDAAIARTIIGLAQSLGLGVMAEGVETEAQRDLLARFGCDCYQGYLFCKPLPVAELEAFMATLPGRAA